MKILAKISSDISSNLIHAQQQYESNLYDISDTVLQYVTTQLVTGSTLVAFSGGPRLNFLANYIEPKMFSHIDVDWQPNTIFVDPSQCDLLHYVIKKLAPTNLLILHSTIFMQYRPWQEIYKDITHLKNFTEKIIVTLPLCRFDYNRLKYSATDVADLLGGVIVDDTVVVCQ